MLLAVGLVLVALIDDRHGWNDSEHPIHGSTVDSSPTNLS